MKKTIVIKNLHDLHLFAKRFSRTLRGGDIIGLVGDLGSGKTTFVQHLAEDMGVKKTVRSPTFVLLQEYQTSKEFREKYNVSRLCHIDAYRLNNENELFAIGFEDYVERHDTVILFEWADRIPSVQWLDHYREVRFDFGEEGQRLVTYDKKSISKR